MTTISDALHQVLEARKRAAAAPSIITKTRYAEALSAFEDAVCTALERPAAEAASDHHAPSGWPGWV